MKLSDYLESRFVQSQISVGEQGRTQSQTPSGVAENQALRVLMWVHLFCFTLFHLCAVIFRFFAIQCRLASPPKLAREIATDHFERQAKAEAANRKLAEEITKNISKESFPEPEPPRAGVH